MLISTWLARLFGDILHNWPLLAILVGSAWIFCLLAVKGLIVTVDEAAAWWHGRWGRGAAQPEPVQEDWPASYDVARALGDVMRDRYVEAEFDAIASYLDDVEASADDAEEDQPR